MAQACSVVLFLDLTHGLVLMHIIMFCTNKLTVVLINNPGCMYCVANFKSEKAGFSLLPTLLSGIVQL